MGAPTTHIDDVLGRGEPDAFPKIRDYLEQRCGKLKLREPPFVHVGMELVQDDDLSVTLTQCEFAQSLEPLPTISQLWAARQKPLSLEDMKLRRCKRGECCWLASAPRPDISARLARIASRVNPPQGSDVYRMNDLAKTVEVWREATFL